MLEKGRGGREGTEVKEHFAGTEAGLDASPPMHQTPGSMEAGWGAIFSKSVNGFWPKFSEAWPKIRRRLMLIFHRGPLCQF